MSDTVNEAQLRDILLNGCEKLTIQPSQQQQQQLVGYVMQMHRWNKAYNLTSVRQPDQMMVKHVLDSLAVLPHLTGERFIDVGTGPGLPGIPLAIMAPEKSFTLLDSLGKRVRFMTQTTFQLGIKNTQPVHSRVEEFTPEQPFDGVLSRAFASLKDMLHWCQHLVDSEGQFLALKGQFPQEELTDVSAHFQLKETIELTVPDLIGERHLVIMSKV